MTLKLLSCIKLQKLSTFIQTQQIQVAEGFQINGAIKIEKKSSKNQVGKMIIVYGPCTN